MASNITDQHVNNPFLHPNLNLHLHTKEIKNLENRNTKKKIRKARKYKTWKSKKRITKSLKKVGRIISGLELKIQVFS